MGYILNAIYDEFHLTATPTCAKPNRTCRWSNADGVQDGSILNVELTHPQHLYWPDLDVDLSVESIEHPERFPLISKERTKESNIK